MKEEIEKIGNRIGVAFLRVQQAPVVRRSLLLLRNPQAALEREEGQNLIEYILATAAVFTVAAAVYALFQAIRGKYGEATNSVNQIQIAAP